MNEKAQKYWDEFWQGKAQPQAVSAEQFGFEHTPLVDELAQLIVCGKKTATCSAHVLYEYDNEPFPVVGAYTVILNSQDDPVAIIKVVDVQIMPMNKVPVEFAIAEGEGDLSYAYWWKGHKEFFTTELAERGMEFSEDMLLVCERFELVDVKKC
jgi:uncharacterized protein YhfF